MMARVIILLLTLLLGSCIQTEKKDGDVVIPDNFDWQGHRGCRGLYPENSIPGFVHALKFPIKTLELDVVVSKDSQLIVSHEPWFNAEICTDTNGVSMTEEVGKDLEIYQLTKAEIQAYDCGSMTPKRFPDQKAVKTVKPTLEEVVLAIREQTIMKNRSHIRYNIELKSRPNWYGKLVPEPTDFVSLVLDKVNQLGIKNRVVLQSFDVNILNEIHQQDSTIMISYLVGNQESLSASLGKLDFAPEVFSPAHHLVDAKLVADLHQQNMKVIPWTVNDTSTMKTLIAFGVDGIITDYPNLIEGL